MKTIWKIAKAELNTLFLFTYCMVNPYHIRISGRTDIFRPDFRSVTLSGAKLSSL